MAKEYSIIHGRRSGKMNAFIIAMKESFKNDELIFVAGLEDPKDIIRLLDNIDIDVKATVMIRKEPIEVFVDGQLGLIFKEGMDIQTGYVFEQINK